MSREFVLAEVHQTPKWFKGINMNCFVVQFCTSIHDIVCAVFGDWHDANEYAHSICDALEMGNIPTEVQDAINLHSLNVKDFVSVRIVEIVKGVPTKIHVLTCEETNETVSNAREDYPTHDQGGEG